MFWAKLLYLSKLDVLCVPDALSTFQLTPEFTWKPKASVPVLMPSEKEEDREKKSKHTLSHERGKEVCIYLINIWNIQNLLFLKEENEEL